MQNATYLFEKPNLGFKNSESRWTAAAQMSLIYISKEMRGTHLPVYNSDSKGYLHKIGHFPVVDFTCLNTVCENKLNSDTFQNKTSEFQSKYLELKPDIQHINPNTGIIIFIEVKTVGASVQRNLYLYNELQEYLCTDSFKCDFYYLLSHGHNATADWAFVSNQRSKILLWEDLFEVMSKTPFSKLIGESLEDYCERPWKLENPTS